MWCELEFIGELGSEPTDIWRCNTHPHNFFYPRVEKRPRWCDRQEATERAFFDAVHEEFTRDEVAAFLYHNMDRIAITTASRLYQFLKKNYPEIIGESPSP